MGKSLGGKDLNSNEQRGTRGYENDTETKNTSNAEGASTLITPLVANFNISDSSSTTGAQSTLTPLAASFSINDPSNNDSATNNSRPLAITSINQPPSQFVQASRNSGAVTPLPTVRHPFPPSKPDRRADGRHVRPSPLNLPQPNRPQMTAGCLSPLSPPIPAFQGASLGKRKQRDRAEDEDRTLGDGRAKARVKMEPRVKQEEVEEEYMADGEYTAQNSGCRKAKGQPVLPGENCGDISEKERKLRMMAQATADEDEKKIKEHLERQKTITNANMPSKEEAMKARKEKGIDKLSEREFFETFGVTRKALAEKEGRLDEVLKLRDQVSEDQVAACGLELEPDMLPKLEPEPEETIFADKERIIAPKKNERRDLFNSLLYTPEIIFELCKQLKPKVFLSLYAISKDFHEVVNGHISHAMLAAAKNQAPESAMVFPFRFYADILVNDPTGRLRPRIPEVRKVPGHKYLQMVVYREKTVRDILALLARQGHRTPKDMPLSIKKMWLLMDIATSAQRVQLFHSKWFTDKDIWNMQLFFVKLDMRFNHPIAGPGHDGIRKLMLGQRSLTPLCKLLKREIGISKMEISKMSIRYAFTVPPEHRGLSMFGIPAEEIGIGHLEGWGKGRVHLIRPDELVMRESVRRDLNLKTHIMSMMLWGYVDSITTKDTPPTEEEMYMSDDAEDKAKGLNWVHPETYGNYIKEVSGHEKDDDADEKDEEDLIDRFLDTD